MDLDCVVCYASVKFYQKYNNLGVCDVHKKMMSK
jgi:hypothetical protein